MKKNDLANMDLGFAKDVMQDRREFLNNLASFKLSKELDKFSYPLKRGERKKYKALIDKADESDDALDELVGTVLTDRGITEKVLDEAGFDEIVVAGKILLLGGNELEYIVKKKSKNS